MSQLTGVAVRDVLAPRSQIARGSSQAHVVSTRKNTATLSLAYEIRESIIESGKDAWLAFLEDGVHIYWRDLPPEERLTNDDEDFLHAIGVRYREAQKGPAIRNSA